MSIIYCSVIAKNGKVVLAESTKGESFDERVHSLVKKMLIGNVGDMIEIEDEKMVTYVRTKLLIFTCVSNNKCSIDRPKRFLKRFIEIILAEYKSLENIIAKDRPGSYLSLQDCLESKLNFLIDEFENAIIKSNETIVQINNDIRDIKENMEKNIKKHLENDNNLNELLVSSHKICAQSEELRKEGKNLEKETRCIKPWMLYFILITAIMLIVYLIFSFYLCGSTSIFCKRGR